MEGAIAQITTQIESLKGERVNRVLNGWLLKFRKRNMITPIETYEKVGNWPNCLAKY